MARKSKKRSSVGKNGHMTKRWEDEIPKRGNRSRPTTRSAIRADKRSDRNKHI